ncbi:DUF4253 domain-containing protein [Actinoallomurus sp. NPDC052308]|uniref:DUF4253 domain-containing protein n=1 Tax=Actinoallomurus sp. NPDC052308 TaxID=3155530 RepID=UPI003420B248
MSTPSTTPATTARTCWSRRPAGGYERYGAEPVAALEVMAWLTVARPPTVPDDSWRLAFEHYLLAESTFSTPAVSLREHARLLLGLDRWVLFSRP